jgi:hypothetical protein
MFEHPPITDEQEIVRVLEEWKETSRKHRALIRKLGFIGGTLFGISWLTRLIASVGHALGWWGRIPTAWELALILIAAPAILLLPAVVLLQSRYKRYSHDLPYVSDVRAVGPLLETVFKFGERPPIEFTQALTRLLPQLKASDARLLSPEQKSILYSSAMHASVSIAGTDAEKTAYRLSALQAITQIGEEKAVKHLEKIVADGWESDKILKAAHFALDAVKQRAEQTKESTTLLRASEDTAADGTLLKPAMPQDAEQDNLLRPVI